MYWDVFQKILPLKTKLKVWKYSISSRLSVTLADQIKLGVQ
jgi:hypothetical protein